MLSKDLELSHKIGEGARADVYELDNKAIKVFKEDCDKKVVFYEAAVHSIIEDTGLPIPKIYEVVKYNNSFAIIMELIKGTSLKKIILKDDNKLVSYLEKTIDLQIKIHRKITTGLPKLKDLLREKINFSSKLNKNTKGKLIQNLDSLRNGNNLCHGDFHFDNILISNGKLVIIDWIDATIGNPVADVCRTYLLLSLYAPDNMASLYLDKYCKKTDKEPHIVLKWLPVIAGARLSESIEGEKDRLMKWI